jgi:hypothetical protein
MEPPDAHTVSICTQFALHKLHEDEIATLTAMPAESIRLLPTHCINTDNQLEGFQLSVLNTDPGSHLCVNRSMFFGHSLFECTTQDQLINPDVVRIMGRDNVSDMRELMKEIETEALGFEASFEHAPDNADAVSAVSNGSQRVSYARGKRAVDSRRWRPELPQVMGLYHANVRGYQKDCRQHKLFIGVSGGCSKCSDSFFNLLIDVGSDWTAKEVADSEEVWFLRKACQRARCMVASRMAKKFGLKILEHADVHSYDQELIGVPTADTIEHDITVRDGRVILQNSCTDTTTLQNGVLCQMNPAEGYWLFKGSPRSSSRSTSFGSMCGHSSGVFPTHSPMYKPLLGNPNYVQGLDSRIVVRYNSEPRSKGVSTVYQCFGEAFLRNLESMGYNRDHGLVELVPLIVGCA